MSKRLPLVVAGLIFLLAAVIHLFRLINHWEVVIGYKIMPMSTSIYGLILAIILSLWMFTAAAK